MWLRRFLGSDEPRDLVYVVAMFAVFVVADRLTLSLAILSPQRLFDSVLFTQAPLDNPLPAFLLVAGLSVLAIIGRSRLWHSWRALDHGRVLQVMAAMIVLWLAWRASAYHFNYLLGQWHTLDRSLVLLLALGSLLRPIFLLPFVAQVRLVNGQFSYPLNTTATQNMDGLLVLVLVAFTAAQLLYVATGKRHTAPALLIMAAAIAAHSFVPGRAKLAMDWLATNDVSNLALNSYTAGWRGQGDGGYAQRLSDLVATMNGPVKLGTLMVELGAVVAIAHHRLLRVWLPFWATFNVAIFAMTGYFFFDWVVLEAALWIVLVTPSLRQWVDENSTPARSLFAMTVVLAGVTFFHAPTLAWFDAPVGYGYEVEATGQSGREYHVPLSAFAPLEHELAFVRVVATPISKASGSYGSINSPQRLREMRQLTNLEELGVYEGTLGPVEVYPDPLSERLLMSFLDHAGQGARPRFLKSAPSRFWTGRPSPSYDHEEPLQTLRAILVTSLIVDGSLHFRRTPVLTVGRGPDGSAMVTARVIEGEP